MPCGARSNVLNLRYLTGNVGGDHRVRLHRLAVPKVRSKEYHGYADAEPQGQDLQDLHEGDRLTSQVRDAPDQLTVSSNLHLSTLRYEYALRFKLT